METKILIVVLGISIFWNLLYAYRHYKNKKEINRLNKANLSSKKRIYALTNEKVELEKDIDKSFELIKALKATNDGYYAKLKKREGILKPAKSVTQLNETGVFIAKYKSLHEAERKTGISRKTIAKHIKSGTTIKGYKFKNI